MSSSGLTDASPHASRFRRRPGGLLVVALLLVLVGIGGMFADMIGTSHNDWSLEEPWYFGSAALVFAAALSLTSIVSVARQKRACRPWWLLIAYVLCVVAGGIGIWGLSLPLLERIG